MTEELTHVLDRVLWENIESRIGNFEEKPPVFYHYSALESLMGMIETNKLWMSKGTFLNDSNELLYIISILEAIEEKIETKVIELFGNNEAARQISDLFTREFRRTLTRFQNELSFDDYEVYILSLTKNKDSLALWYNYAEGDGYNIGFSSEEMLRRIKDFSGQIDNQFNFIHGQVIYEKEKQEDIIISFFMDTIEQIFQRYADINLDTLQKELSIHLFSVINTCSIFFKNEIFKSEEEYRIAFSKRVNSSKETRETEVFFRSQNGIVIPFIMVDFYTKLPIREITIGPKNNIDVAKAGMEQFLKSKGYNVEKINIRKSIAELRY